MILEKEKPTCTSGGEGQDQEGRQPGGRDTKITVTGGGRRQAGDGSDQHLGRRRGGAAVGKAAGAPDWDTAVRGYRTEMEHFAYCVRKWQERKQPVSYEKDASGKLSSRGHHSALPRRGRDGRRHPRADREPGDGQATSGSSSRTSGSTPRKPTRPKPSLARRRRERRPLTRRSASLRGG